MCGRFNFIYNASMRLLFSQLEVTASLTNLFNITPTESIPIILENNRQRECHLARWWLTPCWSNGPDQHYSMFNARAENLEHSRAFKGPFHHRRCLIPATSFIQWQETDNRKQPYEIFRPKRKPIVFAGLWDCWNDEILSCAIVTTQAQKSLQTIHPRMPVMLKKSEIKQWLNPDTKITTLLNIITVQPPYPLVAWAIDKTINNSSAKIQPNPINDVISLT